VAITELADAIAEALANASPPPPTEAATCHWIIYPLLRAAGYVHQEIVPEMADNQGQYPDYTILPKSDHCW
jgi:predicted type IV restriction endonuclease